MDNLTEQELNIGYAESFLEEWEKDAPQQVKENLKLIVDGIEHYRQKYQSAQESYAVLQTRYDQLVGLSAQYLGVINELREQNQQLLVENQRPDHYKE